MRKAFFVLLIALMGFGLAAEENLVYDRFPNALGFYADSSEIVGLTYQRWMGRGGIQSAVSLFAQNTDLGLTYNLSGMAEGKYRVYAEDYAKWLSGALYLAALGGCGYSRDTEYISDTNGDGNLDESMGNPRFTIMGGAGLGFEVVLFSHFSMDLQFLYRINSSLELGLGVGFDACYRY